MKNLQDIKQKGNEMMEKLQKILLNSSVPLAKQNSNSSYRRLKEIVKRDGRITKIAGKISKTVISIGAIGGAMLGAATGGFLSTLTGAGIGVTLTLPIMLPTLLANRKTLYSKQKMNNALRETNAELYDRVIMRDEYKRAKYGVYEHDYSGSVISAKDRKNLVGTAQTLAKQQGKEKTIRRLIDGCRKMDNHIRDSEIIHAAAAGVITSLGLGADPYAPIGTMFGDKLPYLAASCVIIGGIEAALAIKRFRERKEADKSLGILKSYVNNNIKA